MYTWIDLLSIAVAALSAAAAAIIDDRTLRIPNRLTFPLIFLGLSLLALRCIGGFSIALACLTCMASYAFVYGLWKCRLWGGGDAKLVLALYLLASPAYLPLAFIASFSLCLAIVLFMKYAIARRSGKVKATGEPMGPALFSAYLASVMFLTAVPAL